jgi:uncharacterized protein (TIGR01244 family)
MVPVALSDVIAVGEMPTAAQIEILATAGFKSILNTQPDGEVDRVLTASYAHVLAMARNLAYRHVPIESRRPTDDQIAAITAALAELPRPIYACCYSGSRSAAAWAIAVAPHADADSIIQSVASAGYDIGFLREALAARRITPAVEPAVEPAIQPAVAPRPTTGVVNGVAPTVTPPATDAPPLLMPKVIFPSAASDGGYARSG